MNKLPITYRLLGGPHSRSARFGEERNVLPVLGSEPQTVQPPAVAIPTTLPPYIALKQHNFNPYPANVENRVSS